MKWMQGFWSSYKVVKDTLIDRTATTINGIGTLACAVGGAGFSLSNYMEESARTGYYGAVNINGTVNLDVTAVEWGYGFNQTIPFSRNLINTSDGRSFSLSNYVNPATIRWASTVIILSGATFRLVGANLKKWQEGQYDHDYYEKNSQISIYKPAIKEYLYISGESFINSITITSFSFLISKELLDRLLSYLSEQDFTIPFNCNNTITTKDYTGPIGERAFPLDFVVSQDTNVTIPKVNIHLLVNERVNATAVTNVTYGLGVFFDHVNNQRIPLEVSSAAVIIVSLGSAGFFANKARELRDERIFGNPRRGYLEIQA